MTQDTGVPDEQGVGVPPAGSDHSRAEPGDVVGHDRTTLQGNLRCLARYMLAKDPKATIALHALEAVDLLDEYEARISALEGALEPFAALAPRWFYAAADPELRQSGVTIVVSVAELLATHEISRAHD